MSIPVVLPYQQALDAWRREGREPPLLKRMSELISLLDLTVTLDSGLSRREILDSALLIVMGELQVARGALFVRDAGGTFVAEALRGLRGGSPRPLSAELVSSEVVSRDAGGPVAELLEELGLELLCPITRGERLIACLGLGSRANGGAFGPDERAFLRSMAACASTSIENGLMYEELRLVNQRLATKVFQLNGLFDISRELTASLDEEAIQGLVATTLLGQLMASRCVLYLGGLANLRLVHERGVRTGPDSAVLPAEAALVLRDLRGPVPVVRLPACSFRDRLVAQRLSLAVPLLAGAEPLGLAAVGERASGAPFTDEDLDFAQALARQASSALETVRLHRVRVEKERQDPRHPGGPVPGDLSDLSRPPGGRAEPPLPTGRRRLL
jgi:GAF domain-containing protein